jgi:hypothetical protein
MSHTTTGCFAFRHSVTASGQNVKLKAHPSSKENSNDECVQTAKTLLVFLCTNCPHTFAANSPS